MKAKITIKDKQFGILVPSEIIRDTVAAMADKMNTDLKGKNPLFIAVLNGSFLFAADLLKRISVACEISFIKVSSYSGTSSTGKVNELIGLGREIRNRTIVVLEDIVDSGATLETIHAGLKMKDPKEIKTATLLLKPAVYRKKIKLDYVGMSVPDIFLVGYGLDYDGYGRNLTDIYSLKK